MLPKLHLDEDYPCSLVGNWNTWYGEQDQAGEVPLSPVPLLPPHPGLQQLSCLTALLSPCSISGVVGKGVYFIPHCPTPQRSQAAHRACEIGLARSTASLRCRILGLLRCPAALPCV